MTHAHSHQTTGAALLCASYVYGTVHQCYDIISVLLARASGRPFSEIGNHGKSWVYMYTDRALGADSEPAMRTGFSVPNFRVHTDG